MANRDMFDLTGRNALVTGGGRGLGKAMAIGLAQYGANIAIVDIDLETAQSTAAEIRALGVQSLALSGDVRSEEDAQRTVHEVCETLGSLDILLNNAGIATVEPAETLSLADFKRVYDIDVTGVFIFSKAAFGPMSRQGRGNIINMASMAGISVLDPQKQHALQLGQGRCHHDHKIAGRRVGERRYPRQCPRAGLYDHPPGCRDAGGGSRAVGALDVQGADGPRRRTS